jgi:YesN/AraC family two-component response regulator
MKLGIEGYIIKPFLRTEIGLKLLGYYAKKEPERAEQATALCQEVAKLSLAKLMLDKDASETEAASADTDDEGWPIETAEAGEADGTKAEKHPE